MFQVCNWADSCRKMTKFEISGSIYDWWAEACRSWPANYLIRPFSSFSNCLLAVSMAFLHTGHEIWITRKENSIMKSNLERDEGKMIKRRFNIHACFILHWGTTSTSCINEVLHMWCITCNNRINCFLTHATKLLLISCCLNFPRRWCESNPAEMTRNSDYDFVDRRHCINPE